MIYSLSEILIFLIEISITLGVNSPWVCPVLSCTHHYTCRTRHWHVCQHTEPCWECPVHYTPKSPSHYTPPTPPEESWPVVYEPAYRRQESGGDGAKKSDFEETLVHLSTAGNQVCGSSLHRDARDFRHAHPPPRPDALTHTFLWLRLGGRCTEKIGDSYRPRLEGGGRVRRWHAQRHPVTGSGTGIK